MVKVNICQATKARKTGSRKYLFAQECHVHVHLSNFCVSAAADATDQVGPKNTQNWSSHAPAAAAEGITDLAPAVVHRNSSAEISIDPHVDLQDSDTHAAAAAHLAPWQFEELQKHPRTSTRSIIYDLHDLTFMVLTSYIHDQVP